MNFPLYFKILWHSVNEPLLEKGKNVHDLEHCGSKEFFPPRKTVIEANFRISF